jgi:hypothetical protein
LWREDAAGKRPPPTRFFTYHIHKNRQESRCTITMKVILRYSSDKHVQCAMLQKRWQNFKAEYLLSTKKMCQLGLDIHKF